MSLETTVRNFVKKKGIDVQETKDGFEKLEGSRLWMFFERENNKAHYMCRKTFPIPNIEESGLYVFDSPTEREMIVSVRFGCLRDYISQLSGASKPLLNELRERFELHLDDREKADRWIEEKFSTFTYADVYQLLYRFYIRI